LKKYSLTRIKIAWGFIQKFGSHSVAKDAAIVRSIDVMRSEPAPGVIAEGVEPQAQADFLELEDGRVPCDKLR
jgi:EAL domain-containing protein (putative c-di-GMP-specific phosphodiesterase class I)